MAEDNKTTECHACSGVVSFAAKTCPHCGQTKPAVEPEKLKEAEEKKALKGCLWVIVIGVIIMLFGQCSTSDDDIEVDRATATASPAVETNHQSQAQNENAISPAWSLAIVHEDKAISHNHDSVKVFDLLLAKISQQSNVEQAKIADYLAYAYSNILVKENPQTQHTLMSLAREVAIATDVPEKFQLTEVIVIVATLMAAE